jgi:hypothetical protein
MRIRAHWAILAVGIACTTSATAATLDALVAWSNHTRPPQFRFIENPTKTTVEDHFGNIPYAQWQGGTSKNGLAMHGTYLPTAGSGSTWVYDSVHHIAADSFGGDETGDTILYATPPPSKLAQRDLSGVVSAHGLRLGMTANQAALDLGVAAVAVQRIDNHHSELDVMKNIKCYYEGQHTLCAEQSTVFFLDSRAVYIQLSYP